MVISLALAFYISMCGSHEFMLGMALSYPQHISRPFCLFPFYAFLFFGFLKQKKKVQAFSVALESILELDLVDQAGLKLAEILLPLPLECWD